MKTKLVTRYNCDHCGKRGYSAGAMRRHESHCTMNPQRECGMCAMFNREPRPVEELVAMLPAPAPYLANGQSLNPDEYPDYGALGEAVEKVLPALREAVENCPACILAALRQRGIPVPATRFDFKAECQSAWSDFNAARAETAYYG